MDWLLVTGPFLYWTRLVCVCVVGLRRKIPKIKEGGKGGEKESAPQPKCVDAKQKWNPNNRERARDYIGLDKDDIQNALGFLSDGQNFLSSPLVLFFYLIYFPGRFPRPFSTRYFISQPNALPGLQRLPGNFQLVIIAPRRLSKAPSTKATNDTSAKVPLYSQSLCTGGNNIITSFFGGKIKFVCSLIDRPLSIM